MGYDQSSFTTPVVGDSVTRNDSEPEAEHMHTPPVERGTQMGKFVIIGELGRGGMGIVYLGYDQRLDRHAAIKVVRAHSTIAQTRMLREARALARVSHPNVVHVYEVAEHGQDVHVAMEYVEGSSLREWLSASPRTAEEVCRCFIDAGRGLAAIHAAGLIHRDFKPDNVMVGRDGRARVLDLGLAADRGVGVGPVGEAGSSPRRRRRPSTRTAAKTLTSIDACLGTPAYMAPEQHRGEAADARADQFAFCVSLWEALHGERPFKGTTLLALASSVARGVLPQMSNLGVCAQIRAVLARGLRVDPNDRWPSIEVLLAELERALANHTNAKPAPGNHAFGRAMSGLPWVVGAGVLLVGARTVEPPELSKPARDVMVSTAEPAIEQEFVTARAAVDAALVHLSDGDYRGVVHGLRQAANIAHSSMPPGSDEYCSLNLTILSIADQLTAKRAANESRLAYAIALRFAQDCPYFDRSLMISRRDVARDVANEESLERGRVHAGAGPMD